MKHFVMLQGVGNNERGWARVTSKFGKVTLIQHGMVEHVEKWEDGQKIFDGPNRNLMRTRFWDESLFSALTSFRALACVRKYLQSETTDITIAGNYSQGLPALWLRLRGKTRRVVVLLTDYLPQRGSFAVRLHRRLTNALNCFVAKHADEVWAVSPRIPAMQANPRHFVVPICLDDHQVPMGDRQEIGYIGVPTPDHALDLLFEICKKHNIKLNVIGDSPYLQSIKHLAPPDTVFHGLMNDAAKINQIMSRCFCGYAIYRNTGPQGYSFYGIPSKTFAYFSSNTPAITTNTAHFTPRIEEFGVGRVVEPDAKDIEQAILQIRNEFPKYYLAINEFRKTWNSNAEQFHRERFAALGIL
jgi:glycosyltransferase involved in cell wall biosynthesis